MSRLDFKQKNGKLIVLYRIQELLFVEKILSHHDTSSNTLGRLNCHAWNM